MSTALKPAFLANLAMVANALSTVVRKQKFNIEHLDYLYYWGTVIIIYIYKNKLIKIIKLAK